MKTIEAILPIPKKYTKQYLEDAKETFGEDAYNRQFRMNSTVRSQLTIYYNWSPVENVRNCTLDENYPIVLSPDFNISEKAMYMAWVVMQDIDGDIYVIDELPMPVMSVSEACQVYKSKYDRAIPLHIYGDPSGWSRQQAGGENNFQVMMRELIPWSTGGVQFHIRPTYTEKGTMRQPPHPPRVARHNAVNRKIKDSKGIRHLFVDPNCEMTLRTVGMCLYKPGKESDNENEIGHIWCGIGYFISKKYPFVYDFETATQRILDRMDEFSRDIDRRINQNKNRSVGYLGTEA